ncbi:MAG: cytochrome c [Devosia sp.]|uniref:c-type cytochrome n=1 Tax=Devosia sp. TaxID=1871048 RepID=UPI001AC32E92|nr:cytochrome c [Devosia sp.]MBN9308786.1 cytochrome c [Devosia sp.]MBN9317276.1 cytochrome c [Devosia sp.]
MMSLFRAEVVKAVLAWLVILGVLGGLGALAFVYSGFFNVAATTVDSAPLQWLLVTAREASIQLHARDIEAPTLGGAEQVERGFRFFRQECAMCHNPPGREPTAMSAGLNPKAPDLPELVEDMTDAELFWVTRNGIRFTGMPAWATSSYGDEMIWDVVTYMRASVDMQAADYDALDQRLPPD